MTAPWGPYKSGSVVFVRDGWHRVDEYGRVALKLEPQPAPPPPARRAALLNAARKVPLVRIAPPVAPPKAPGAPGAPRESAPPMSMLPSQIGNIAQTVMKGVQTGMQIAGTVSNLASSLGAFGPEGADTGADTGAETGRVLEPPHLGSYAVRFVPLVPRDADTGIPPPNMTAEAGVNVGLTVLASAYPPWTTAIAGVAKLAMTIWNAVDSAFRDTFHPTALQAEEWLTLFRIDPGLLFSGVDVIHTPEQAARLVRYLKLISGEHPMQKGWGLHNPNDGSPDNPYQNEVDPTDPLTDPKYLQRIHDTIFAAKNPANRGKYLLAMPAVQTPETAKRLLAILRHGLRQSGLLDWSETKANLANIAGEIARVRVIAGESGPDAALAKEFGPGVNLPKLKAGQHLYVPKGGMPTVTSAREAGELLGLGVETGDENASSSPRGEVRYIKQRVLLRESPDRKARGITDLLAGREVRVVERSITGGAEWARIDPNLGGVQGWVESESLSTLD